DACGNQAEAVSVTYTWTVDTEAPVITSDSQSGDLGCNPKITPPLFKADDNCAGEVDLEPETEGPTADGCNYTQTWTANYTDPCGNMAEELSVTYTWTMDNEAPVITSDSESADLGCNPEIVPPMFKADDNCAGEVELEPETEGPIADGCNYTQTWTANYTDPCGNMAEELSVTYTWTMDTEAPVITSDSQSGDLGCNPKITPPLFKADDNCAGEVDLEPETEGPTADGCNYTQTWTANYTDPCGNMAEELSVTYTWTMDNEAPVITSDSESADLGCNPKITPPLFKADDNCAGEVELEPETEGPIADGCNYTQTWTANYTDPCGNMAEELSVTYTWIVDNDAPEIDVPEMDPLCNDYFPESIDANWTDNCSDGGIVTGYIGNIVSSECQETADYVFTVTDACGNIETETLTLIREFESYGECETAFGRYEDDNICFIGNGFNRWGWTNYLETEGEYTLQMYAGAAHCDITRGAYAGDVHITYENGQVNVMFDINDGYTMNEAHLYVGCDMYPTGNNGSPTVAPGQYNFNPSNLGGVSNYSIGPIDASGPIYVIAHAVVCEVECECSATENENDGGQYMPSNHDSINCGSEREANVLVNDKLDFTASPVPFDDEVFINYEFKFDTDVKIEVFDLRGIVLKTITNTNYSKGTKGKTRINMNNASDQIYVVRVTTSKGVITKNIISATPRN
uniref:T9SS type A sorting domain-containing protein n=1 Tax=Hanstruepera flava TaxID=2930218 RepID=UPI00202951FD